MPTPLTLAIFQYLQPGGMTNGSWRHPDNTAVDYLDIEHWTRLATKLDEAAFDFIFFADAYSYPILDDRVIPGAIAEAINFPQADPIVIISAMAAVTSRLGFVVTSSTTVERPQIIARRYATLDNFTKGRLGWNIVTGSGQAASARLFGEEMIAHDERYRIAEDHVQLTLKFWEGSWEEGALLKDKDARVFADPAKVHEIEHHGPYFTAHGLLTVPPSPQRTPLLLQAGTSGPGRAFAAQYAESVFLAGGDPAHVAANIADIRRLAVEFGRTADSIKFLVGASFITAPSEAEAQAKREEMLALATTEAAGVAYAYFTGIDLLSMDPDAPLGDVRTEQGQSSVDRFAGDGAAPAPTVREILEDYRRNGVNGSTFVGDPESVADQIEVFVEATGADGFLIQPYLTPTTYDDFIDLLLPVLRRRGLARPEAAGDTLREHLFGAGHAHLPPDHPGAALRVR